MKITILILVTIVIAITACTTSSTSVNETQQIIDNSIQKHGGHLLDNAVVTFEFRNRIYSYKNENGNYEYSRTWQDSTALIKDVMTNDTMYRLINDELAAVPDTQMQKYANSVNSVMYFAFLPYKLNDPAVNKELLGTVVVKDQNYHKIKVTFNEAGGGEDFEDVFVYWINQTTNLVDFLAYSYDEDDDRGYRFRVAYNSRVSNGVVFQDYINMKPKSTEADVLKLDEAYLNDELKELSRIILENEVVSIIGN